MISVIKLKKVWFIISLLAVAASVILWFTIGLKLGIDFTGGSLLELDFTVNRPTSAEVTEALTGLELGTLVVQPIGETGMVLRFRDVDEDTHQRIIETLKTKFYPDITTDSEGVQLIVSVLEEKRFESIGPTIGQELRRKTAWAIGIVIIAIIVYIAWAFRKISQPVASWKYGIVAVIALFHDIALTVGIFIVLGALYSVEVNAAFVAALLTILGYSVNDTIVVFDRTRENLTKRLGENFEKIVDDSVNQVMTRSINASVTTLMVLFAVLLLGGQTIREFTLALIIGIAIGTYSSIFIASPLLVILERLRSPKA